MVTKDLFDVGSIALEWTSQFGVAGAFVHVTGGGLIDCMIRGFGHREICGFGFNTPQSFASVRAAENGCLPQRIVEGGIRLRGLVSAGRAVVLREHH